MTKHQIVVHSFSYYLGHLSISKLNKSVMLGLASLDHHAIALVLVCFDHISIYALRTFLLRDKRRRVTVPN
jgi:hypothetical protein